MIIFNRRTFIPSFVAGALIATSAAAQTEIKLGHVGEPGSLVGAVADEFAKRANERLAGKAKVIVYGSSQLGGDSDMMKKLKLGTIDLSEPSTVLSSYVASFGLFEMPYLVKDREHMKRIRDEVLWPTMAPEAEKQGYRILGVWENGFRQITNNKHPIKVPDDLKGIKLRVPQGEWRVKMFQAYGANPSPLAFSEVFVALQTGVMDGQENPLAQIDSARFYELQKYLSMTGHVYTPSYLIAGRSWSKFDPEVQKVLSEVGKEMQDVALQMGEQFDNDLLKKMKAAGIQVNDLDKDTFIKASDAVYQEFAKQVPEGKALIDKSLALGKTS
ncbi:MAG: TRAP transporter substrate-binding protein [Microvirga sp.]|jgi:tripartite ATP-independent transporter DctP family solute receptor|nr:TRAP transporter substrate-binding protein [Beijerinckiaceae bacterium]